MNHEIKQRWVDALKSGEYEQAKEQLHPDENGFCCLGVLCDLHRKSTNTTWKKEDEFFSYMEYVSELPPEVVTWAELDTCDYNDGLCWVKQLNNSLGALNDEGKSFEEIADVIENYL